MGINWNVKKIERKDYEQIKAECGYLCEMRLCNNPSCDVDKDSARNLLATGKEFEAVGTCSLCNGLGIVNKDDLL